MSIVGFLSLLARRTILRSRVALSNRAWVAQRKVLVLDSLLNPVSPLHGQPYIQDGIYEWYVEKKLHLDFYFPESKLAVRVAGRHHAPYSRAAGNVPSRKFWEASTADDYFVVDVCQRNKKNPTPLLLVGPDDPVDPYSLAERVRQLLKI